jgi:hypothetical protein
MRRAWAAGAAFIVCLALGGAAALAQEVSPAPSRAAPPAGPDGPTAEELVLLSGVRKDLQGTCVPLRTDLAGAALAGIEHACDGTDVDTS